MAIDLERKEPMYEGQKYDYGKLDISQLDILIDVPDINSYPNEEYALIRKHGLGTSDSSILCGVNPYTRLSELIEEKSRDFLTQEEKEVGNKAAVRTGRDLEPIIIDKHSKVLGKRIIKPSDMYVHKEYPWLKFNFDGVIDKIDLGDGRYQYIPDEIKAVTRYGVKHYDPSKAWYRESMGFLTTPEDHSKENNSIETKAAEYGIPPYYYTQLQQQIFGLKAPYGYLTVIFVDTWELVSFMAYRDDNCIAQILSNGWKTWEAICKKTGDPNRADVTKLLHKMEETPEEAPTKRKGTYTVINE